MRTIYLPALFILIFIQCHHKNVITSTVEPVIVEDTNITSKRDTTLDSSTVLQIDKTDYPFIREQNWITAQTNPKDINDWILKRIENAKKGSSELVQIPVSIVESICGHACSLYFIPTQLNDPDRIWINPNTDEYTLISDRYIIGNFTGEQPKYHSPDLEHEYRPYTFNVLKVKGQEQSEVYEATESLSFIHPKVISPVIYQDFQLLSNIEFYEYSILYDGDKYSRIIPDLPKTQHALVHKDSQIEVLFKGLTFPSDITQKAFVQQIQKDTKDYTHVVDLYNASENWYLFEGIIPRTNTYLISKKWFFEDNSWTFNIELKVHPNQLELAHKILTEFDSQIIPQF